MLLYCLISSYIMVTFMHINDQKVHYFVHMSTKHIFNYNTQIRFLYLTFLDLDLWKLCPGQAFFRAINTIPTFCFN